MTIIQNAQISALRIFNNIWPNDDCPKMIPLNLDFNSGGGGADLWELNLTEVVQQHKITGIQACYWDNSENGSDVVFEGPDTQFRTFFRANYQGFRPMFFGEVPIGRFTSQAGNGIFRILFTNTPVVPYEWKAI